MTDFLIEATLLTSGLFGILTDKRWLVQLFWAIVLYIGVFVSIEVVQQKGREEGAYKMLKNEYKISYVINSDSIITDTIIHLE